MSVLEKMVTPLGFALRGKRSNPAKSLRSLPQFQSAAVMQLTSTSFPHHGEVPKKYAGRGRGENISPALSWSATPPKTRQMLLIMEDIDVPIDNPSIHMIALFPPTISELLEGDLNLTGTKAKFIPPRGDLIGYFGPRALPGHGVHRYGFHLYALDIELYGVDAYEDVKFAVTDHILAAGFYEGVQKG